MSDKNGRRKASGPYLPSAHARNFRVESTERRVRVSADVQFPSRAIGYRFSTRARAHLPLCRTRSGNNGKDNRRPGATSQVESTSLLRRAFPQSQDFLEKSVDHRCFGASVLRCFGASVLRCFGASVLRCFGASVLRYFGTSALRHFGTSVLWQPSESWASL
jgi:hypothetical protein